MSSLFAQVNSENLISNDKKVNRVNLKNKMTKAHEKCLDSMDEIRMDLKEIHVKIFNILKEMIEAYKLTAREKNVTCSILNERLSCLIRKHRNLLLEYFSEEEYCKIIESSLISSCCIKKSSNYLDCIDFGAKMLYDDLDKIDVIKMSKTSTLLLLFHTKAKEFFNTMKQSGIVVEDLPKIKEFDYDADDEKDFEDI